MSDTPDFESIKQIDSYGVEHWSARDLAPLLGYTKWERFEGVIQRAMTSCAQSENIVEDYFPSAGKMIETGRGAMREVVDYALSRLACYLVAQNGDPRKPEMFHVKHFPSIIAANTPAFTASVNSAISPASTRS
jgi:DNA-damage-inducible protein D